MSWEDEDKRLVITASIELDDYLNSSQLFWRLTNSASPLTPGNLLLSIKKLESIDSCLSDVNYQSSIQEIGRILKKRPSIWDKKITEEIAFRTRLWLNSVEEIIDDGVIDHSIISQIKDRVIIEMLFSEARIIDPGIRIQIEKADDIFRGFYRNGSFLWDHSLAKLFSKEEYWFLYVETGKVRS